MFRYRKNPLKDPEADIKGIISSLSKEVENKKSRFATANQEFYSDPNEHQLRWMLEYLGEWAAVQDVIIYYQELLDALKENPTALEPLLEALMDRADHIVLNPANVRHRFYEMQEQAGVNFEDINFENIEYGDYFVLPVDQFVYNYLHRFTFWIFHGTLQKLLAATRSPDWHTYEDQQLVNLRHQEMAANLTENQLQNILDDINSIISGRTTYGLRGSPVSGVDTTKLAWSNGSKSWHIWSSHYDIELVSKYVTPRKGDLLDANIIVVPYPSQVVELLLSSLYPLPLYQYSFEAKVEKRRAGKTGPLVTDREVKQIIMSIVRMAANKYHQLLYGEDIDVGNEHWMINRRAASLFKELSAAKAERDKEKFIEILNELTTVPASKFIEERVSPQDLRLNISASFIGRLTNWFDMLTLEGPN